MMGAGHFVMRGVGVTEVVLGVCGGIADSIGISPTIVRVLWLLLSLIPGPLWVAYVLLWIFMPKAPAARY